MYIVGRKPVIEAIELGVPIHEILVYHGSAKSLKNEILSAQSKGIKVTRCEKHVLEKIAGSATHQGIAAETEEPLFVGVEDIVEIGLKEGRGGLVLILDEIQDPQNVGAIIRSALAAGVNGVVITKKHSSPPITPATIKASAAAVLKMPIAVESNIALAIEKLKNLRYVIYGADAKEGQPYYNAEFNGNVAIVMGGEASGMRKLTKQKCDFIVHIPMKSEMDSLNVSAAGAVILFEIARKQAKNAEKSRK